MSSALQRPISPGMVLGIALVIALLFCLPRVSLVYHIKNADGFWLDWAFRISGAFMTAACLLYIGISRLTAPRVLLYQIATALALFAVLLSLQMKYFPGRLPAKVSSYLFALSYWLEVVLLCVTTMLLRVSIKKQRLSFELQNLQLLHSDNTLNQLKNQLKPHFFFNALTTLKGLILYSPRQAADFVDELSDFFRTLLEMNDKRINTVREELELAKCYCHLMKARFPNSFFLTIRVPDEILHCLLPAVSIQSLVENSFKHTNFSESAPLFIEIFAESDKLIVQNNYNPVKSLHISTGTGLQNLNNRFLLLFKKTILWEEVDDCFKVHLPLQFN